MAPPVAGAWVTALAQARTPSLGDCSHSAFTDHPPPRVPRGPSHGAVVLPEPHGGFPSGAESDSTLGPPAPWYCRRPVLVCGALCHLRLDPCAARAAVPRAACPPALAPRSLRLTTQATWLLPCHPLVVSCKFSSFSARAVCTVLWPVSSAGGPEGPRAPPSLAVAWRFSPFPWSPSAGALHAGTRFLVGVTVTPSNSLTTARFRFYLVFF